jgi:DNA repair exonuclease SbcCD ATPase subunit
LDACVFGPWPTRAIQTGGNLLALAETRRHVIDDLQARLKSLVREDRRTKDELERRVRALQSTLDKTQVQARKDASQIQYFYAVALSDLRNDLRHDLERKPPDVDAALTRIHRLLSDVRPAA